MISLPDKTIRMKTTFRLLFIAFTICTSAGMAQNLRLEDRILIDGIVLFEDSAKPGQFYYVPDSCVIAMDEKRNLQVSLDKYVSEKREDPAGGIIQYLIDFSLPKDKQQEVERKLRLKKPGVEIVGAVPLVLLEEHSFQLSTEKHRVSFEFFPPASALITMDVSKTYVQLLQGQVKTIGLFGYIPMTCAYEIQFDGYAEIQPDTLKMLLNVDSASIRTKLIRGWLQQKTLRLFSNAGAEIALLDQELTPAANYFAKNLSALPATFLLEGNGENYVFDSASIRLENGICNIRANGSSLAYQFNYSLIYLDEKKKEIKGGSYNLNGSIFNTREANVILDLELEELIYKVKSYHIDFKMMTGTMGRRFVYVLDSLTEKINSVGNRQTIQYPMFRSLSKRMKYQERYSYSIKQYVEIFKFNLAVNESKWKDGDWAGIIVNSAFQPINMFVEGDVEEMVVNGFQGVRVEFFGAEKKDDEGKDMYKIGRYLGDLVFVASQIGEPFIEKNLLRPRGDEGIYYYKITWFLKPSKTKNNRLNNIIETSPEMKINDDYLFLTLPVSKQ